MYSEDPSFSVWSFFSSHPPWISPTSPHVGSEPFQPVPESFLAPSPFRPRHSSLRHWWSLWNASTNTDKDKLLENKHSPGAAVRVQEGRPGSSGETRTPGWWQGQLCLPSLLPLDRPVGKEMHPADGETEWGHCSQLKIHFWSNRFNFLTPFLELFSLVWLYFVQLASLSFLSWGSQAGFSLWTWEFVLQCFF